jgi:hypothetical protein
MITMHRKAGIECNKNSEKMLEKWEEQHCLDKEPNSVYHYQSTPLRMEFDFVLTSD